MWGSPGVGLLLLPQQESLACRGGIELGLPLGRLWSLLQPWRWASSFTRQAEEAKAAATVSLGRNGSLLQWFVLILSPPRAPRHGPSRVWLEWDAGSRGNITDVCLRSLSGAGEPCPATEPARVMGTSCRALLFHIQPASAPNTEPFAPLPSQHLTPCLARTDTQPQQSSNPFGRY